MSTFAAELLKLRTIRAPYGLVLAVVAISGLAVAGSIGGDILDGNRALGIADAAESASVFAALIGILVVTNEYRHGTITPTFLVTPIRERVIAAKLGAGAVAGAIAGLVVVVVVLAIAVPWLASRDEPLAYDGDLLLSMAKLVAAFTLASTLGVAAGTVIRSQIGAVATVFAWFLLVEPVLSVLASVAFGWDELGRYLPGAALDAVVSSEGDDLLAPHWGALLALGYIAALTAAGIALTLRRDAD